LGIMQAIEAELERIGHLDKMRRDGSWLLGPCPRCGKNETLETFAIHEKADSLHWLCGRCNRSGETIASLEAFIAGEPTPAPAQPKTNGGADEQVERDRKECVALYQKVVDAERERDAAGAVPKKANGKRREIGAAGAIDAMPDTPADNVVELPARNGATITATADATNDDELQVDDPRYREREIAALAKMPKGVDRGIRRRNLARDLNVSRSDIDDEIERYQAEEESNQIGLYPHWETKHWPDPVDTDAILRDIIQKIHKHVVLPRDEALAVALWIMFAWVHDAGIRIENYGAPVSRKMLRDEYLLEDIVGHPDYHRVEPLPALVLNWHIDHCEPAVFNATQISLPGTA